MASTPRRHGETLPLDDADVKAPPDGEHHGASESNRAPSAAEDSSDDVQAYLQELFGRYNLAPASPDKAAAVPRRADADPKPVEPAHQNMSPPEPPAPRRLPEPKPPPECRRDILALRELSTRSARGAIAHFDTGRLLSATWARFWLCGGALGTTLFFLRFVQPWNLRTLGAAAVALTLAVYWCGQFWLLTHRAARIGAKSGRRHPAARLP